MALVLGLAVGLAAVLGVLLGAAIVDLLARRTILPPLLAFAAGTLLGTALLGLLPEAAERLPVATVARFMLLAVIGFFLLEKVFRRWHSHDLEPHGRTVAGYLILAGDSLHNAVDGLLLGATFAADPWLGLMLGVAVLAHEVPQEVGDFVLLVESGLPRRRALAYNLLSAATIFPGVVAGHVLADVAEGMVAVAVALAAGAFLYVALADLVPILHRRGLGWLATVRHQVAPILGGIALIWLLAELETLVT